MFSHRPIAATLCLSVLLAGCSSLPADLGRHDVEQQLADRGLNLPEARRDPAPSWLAEPLSLDRAIQLALLDNPELRATTAQLGIAAADVYEAGRLANPLLSATSLSAGGEPHTQLTLGIAVNFTDLLFLHARTRIAAAQFDSARLTVGNAALALAAEVEAAYRRVAAAEQQAQLQAKLAQAAQTAAALAQRYAAAGNLAPRDLALEQAAATQAALAADAAGLERQLARADFSRLLGLGADDDDRWRLAEPLALPAAAEDSVDDLLKLAMATRLDLAAARRHADAVAQRYGLTRRSRWLGDIEVGAERERDYDGSVHGGPSARIALPLFDWGRGRAARGAAELQIAEAEVRARELDVIHEVRAADARVRDARQRVERYRTQLIPAREDVVEQTQRAFNYMLVDVFDLLATRQQADAAYTGYIDALRDYWVARAGLAQAVGRRLPSTPASEAAVPLPVPAPTAGDCGMAAMPDMPMDMPMPATADCIPDPASATPETAHEH
ncbi:TolC family protein [Solimonas terrae]|uniref:TolC family protein n=1 Tax=Solimonas terrae TaxID=1396819 RepID=A0A6M2BQT8_9GAMM|nr:TolC family protein [Solimonas terrae]NGY04585.1 TolC family protein [Solimonas terrae]